MKHTPGPWTVILRGERGTFHIPEAQKHEAERSDDGLDGYTVSKANAHLIAAAPELLEALRRVLHEAYSHEAVDCGDHCSTSCLWCAVQAAIAKAEGR